ncbi:hypothetical protein ETAA8_12110 [Anatilimnocola aggregata]|uniref:Uncharacterized protein n=1 Tax=Anatilimnocola aggregata TaxID=2528021 RepID=A0A517Y7E2_9BACT|nr:hypothetical protein [Anatilimnocola aggregata]QDU26137.1 hypothetical protein ETAA8_12110 [Anatilimnocola aggregata]
MNDHLSTDQRRLELATTRQLPSIASLDAKLTSERQAWLAVGAAFEEVGRTGLDEQALLAKLQGELIKAPTPPVDLPAEQMDWSWGAVTVAAVVLIAATVIGAISQRSAKNPVEQTVQQPKSGQPIQLHRERSRPDSPQVVRQQPAAIDSPVVAETGTSSWDDLDAEIQTTYTALQELSSQSPGVDQSLTDFDAQLKRLSADIAGESL